MGLLTDPSDQEKIPNFILKYHHILCGLSYVVGIVWFTVLAIKPYGLSVYFSENALLPGLVRGHFDANRDAERFYDHLKTEADRYPNNVPDPWIVATFTQLGLETYTQKFVVNNPLGSRRNITATNIYAILRAPRTASTEAIVLCSPYRPSESVLPSTLSGIAIMMAAAKYFKRHTYWAKDIIFLVTQHEQLGMQAWLDAYHETTVASRVLHSDDLPGRSGSIQAALNIEISSNRINHFNVKIEGLNGQLPNLDFFNLVYRLCVGEGFHVTFKGLEEKHESDFYLNWKNSMTMLMAMMRTQATGTPTGNHGLFHRYRIEALTLEGKSTSKFGRTYGYAEMGLLIEGIFRSLNNLLERFHQSFFFYLLPSTTWFVSIGLYMPAYTALVVGIIIKAIALRIETSQLSETQTKALEIGTNLPETVDYSFSSTVPLLILTHTVGVILYSSPEYIVQIGNYLHIKPEASITSVVFAIYFAIIFLPRFITLRYSTKAVQSWKVLKCVALFELALLTLAMAFINFSLAFIITVIYFPICIGITPSRTKFRRFVKGLPVLLASPLGLAFLFATHDTYATFPDVGMWDFTRRSFQATRSAILYSIHDSYIYSNWMFGVACTFLIPTWLQFWIITLTKDKD